MSIEDSTAEALLRTGLAVPIRVIEESVLAAPDEAEFGVRLELSFDDEDSPEEDRDEVVEWGALGFLFAIGVLSFADARPRGISEQDYVAADEFGIDDLLNALKYVRGQLHLDADYVRGRRVKTRAAVRPDGTGFIETRGRGKAALRWIARLKGEKPLYVLK